MVIKINDILAIIFYNIRKQKNQFLTSNYHDLIVHILKRRILNYRINLGIISFHFV